MAAAAADCTDTHTAWLCCAAAAAGAAAAESNPHHQHAIPSNPQADAVLDTDWNPCILPVSVTVSRRTPHWVLLLCWLPLPGWFCLASLASLLRATVWGLLASATWLRGWSLNGGREAICNSSPFQPPK
eukprot:1140667-Pelagomonas_calceolata.AAC.4